MLLRKGGGGSGGGGNRIDDDNNDKPILPNRGMMMKRVYQSCCFRCLLLFLLLSKLVLLYYTIFCSNDFDQCNPFIYVGNKIVHKDYFRFILGALSLHRLLPLTPEEITSTLFGIKLQPEYCSAMARFGHFDDGGWNVCLDPEFLPSRKEEEIWNKLRKEKPWPPLSNKCVIYSFGSNRDFSFEYSMSRFSSCEVHTFDPTMSYFNEQPLKDLTGISFHHIPLGPSNSFPQDSQTVKQIMNWLGHKEIEILKIDVEGDEWGALEEMILDKSLKNVRQLVMEIHLRRVSLERVKNIFKGLEENHFKLWSRLDNWRGSYIVKFGGYHIFHAMELSFVRVASP